MMHADASQSITRVLFEGFAGWAVTLFYLSAAAAVIVFAWGCWLNVRKYLRGPHVPVARVGARVLATLNAILSHRTVRRRDTAAGHTHSLLFYAFTLLFLGTATITLEVDFLEPLFGVRFWYGWFYLWFSLILDLAGVAMIIALGYFMVRRGFRPPSKLDYARPDRQENDPDADRTHYRREDWAFLWLLLLIGMTGFLLEALRLVWLRENALVWEYRWWSPVGALLEQLMPGLSAETAGGLRAWTWWTHGVLALVFIALIPYTKAKHMFAAVGSLLVRDAHAAPRLVSANIEQEHIGYNTLADMRATHLLQLDACTKCGRCHEACPAVATGAPLSPRDLILSLRELSESGFAGSMNPFSQSSAVAGERSVIALRGKGMNQIRDETLWSCLTCAACVEICPVAVEHVPIIAELRRGAVEQGDMPAPIQTVLQSIQKTGNSFGEPKRKRPAWTKKLNFRIKDARSEPVEVLWFVGDFASFDPRAQKVSQDFARILNAAGVDFGILHEDEMTAGNDVRRVGEEGLYQHLVEHNRETIAGCELTSIVTTDPHSYNTLKNEYPDFGARYVVEHASEFLQRLLDSGRIKLERTLNRRATFHDPCHLGRYNHNFDPPRAVIRATGTALTELGRTRDNSFCCGGGGGRVWQPDASGRERPSVNRMREVAGMHQLDTLVVGCPKCMTMLEDAAKTVGCDTQFAVKDVVELVAEAMNIGNEDIAG